MKFYIHFHHLIRNFQTTTANTSNLIEYVSASLWLNIFVPWPCKVLGFMSC